MQPIVSVIVPVYNTENYLRRCVDSLRQQTIKNIEIVLIDDGSVDGSPALCDEFAAADNRVRVIHQQNSGVSAARNAGLNVASGLFIAFLDSDDFISDNCYETLAAMINESDSDTAACAIFTEDKNGILNSPSFPEEIKVYSAEEAIKQLLICGNISYSMCDKLLSRSAIGNIRFDTGISHNEDFLFCYEVLKRCGKIAYTSRPMYYYCYNGSSAVRSRFSHKRMSAIDVQEKVLFDISVNYPDLYSTARLQYLKVNLFTAAAIAEDGYDNSEDIRRLRKNVKKHLTELLLSQMAGGYKIYGLLLSIHYGLFKKYIHRKCYCLNGKK